MSKSNKLDLIEGAIIGLDDLRERLERIKKREKQDYFVVSVNWVESLIDSHINIYKNLKIKELESVMENGRRKKLCRNE